MLSGAGGPEAVGAVTGIDVAGDPQRNWIAWANVGLT